MLRKVGAAALNILCFLGLGLSALDARADDPLIVAPARRTVGVYYFGIFSPRMFDVSRPSPLNTVSPMPWWEGVYDLYYGVGPTFRYWTQPPYSNSARSFSHLMPLIGYYDQSKVSVLEQHIEQAATNGIDYFNFYWYWSNATGAPAYSDGLSSFRIAKNKAKLKFMISIYTGDPNWAITYNNLPKVLDTILDYFQDPSYLLSKSGNPILTIGDGSRIFLGTANDVDHFIQYLGWRAAQRNQRAPEVHLAPGATNDWTRTQLSSAFHCLWPSYTGFHGGDSYGNFVSQLQNSLSYFSSQGRPLVPCMGSDLNERPRFLTMIPANRPDLVRYFGDQSPQKFYQGLKVVRDWQDGQRNDFSHMISLYAWNEWHEGGIIEPNVRDGFLYLNLIQAAFRTVPLVRYAGTSVHRVTTLPLDSSWRPEAKWLLFTESKPGQGRVPVYECQKGADTFLSLYRNCEGQSGVGLMGYLATASTPNSGLVPLYRCATSVPVPNHFVSSAANCEGGGTNEGLLGYGIQESLLK